MAALSLPRRSTLTILEAETGSGKTEAALFHYLRLFERGHVDGVYIALPTRTSATQIYRRVVAAVRRSFPLEQSRPPVVLAVPGYLGVDDRTGVRLPGYEVRWPDGDDPRLQLRGWAAEMPKRYLAGSVVVGTIDQVLLSTLRVSHAHLRASALSRLLLVVDEVHASDAYMGALLESVLATHLECGGHALLMSATLGDHAATQYARVAGGDARALSLGEAHDKPYPAITWVGADSSELICAQTPGRPKDVVVSTSAMAEDPEAIARVATRHAAQGASVLVIRNTVGDCRATVAALEAAVGDSADHLWRCGGVVTAHHSRFAKPDREALDQAVEAAFGKARGVVGQVLVGTQTLQQSLDIDADLLISDLCPMDVLLQRVGRLHRHHRVRPAGYEAARCLVVVPEERDLRTRLRSDGEPRGSSGIGSVYQDLRIIEATWREIMAAPTWHIPADNRRLVESATHPDALDAIVTSLGGPFVRHAQWVVGEVSACRRIASGHLVDRHACFGTRESEFPSRDVSGRIATRLGASDRQVEFDAGLPGAFGTVVRKLTIPDHLVRGAAADAEPQAARPTQSGFCFGFGSATYRYDRLGLHLEEERE